LIGLIHNVCEYINCLVGLVGDWSV